MAGMMSLGLNHSLISRSASASLAEAWIKLSIRSPIAFPSASFTGTTVPRARMVPGARSRATCGLVGPERARTVATASIPE